MAGNNEKCSRCVVQVLCWERAFVERRPRHEVYSAAVVEEEEFRRVLSDMSEEEASDAASAT